MTEFSLIHILTNCGTPFRAFKSEAVGQAVLRALRANYHQGDNWELTVVYLEEIINDC